MKKILLSIILIFMLLAIPVAADTPYRLIVDNVLLDKPVAIINNVSYVPIRAIADIFNATTDWDGETKTISIKTKEIARPPINGDVEFTEKINEALDLLEQKDFPHYVMVCENTSAIKQVAVKPADAPKGSIASANTNGETIIHPELVANPKYYDPIILAGVLTHEVSHHIDWRYKDNTHREKEAYAHEGTVFKLLDAPQWLIDRYK